MVAGFVSAQADTVYSQNVVGYINITVPAGGFQFFGNQLVNGSDVAKTNNNIQSVLSSGLVSSPAGNINTKFYFWNGGGYDIFAYYTGADAAEQFDPSFGSGWYDTSGNFASVALKQGAGGGHFIKNPASTNITITVVGQVLQGTNVYTIAPGFNTYTFAEPVSTNLNSSLVNFPATSSAAGNINDQYFHFNGSGYDILTYYTSADAAEQFDPSFGDGWYDTSGNLGSANPALFPKVGEGFFIKHRAGTTVTWTNKFVVQ